MTATIGVGMLGCGYVADSYRLGFPLHPELRLVAVCDRQRARAEAMGRLTGAALRRDIEALCADPDVDLVLNLTAPRDHYATTRALLEAGKHVYVEKPLSMTLHEAQSLVALADARGRMLSGAPCTLLNRAAQTLWRALREDAVGPVRLVYAEMDDGMVARAPTAKWVNSAGVVWPAVDEFEVGCTVEHAGYVLTWLCAFFGPAETVTAFSAETHPDKIPGLRLTPAPDLSVACIRFRSGVVARVTNGLYAPHDHRLRLFGDEGVLSVDEPWDDAASVSARHYRTLRRRRFLGRRRNLPLLGPDEDLPRFGRGRIRDFLRGAADMAAALREGRRPTLDARFGLHVTELTLACHVAGSAWGADPGFGAAPYAMTTSFDPPAPAPWAA